jgi:hypothetical protein
MKKWKRSVFFWVLTLLCLGTIPLVVLNAAGYRFDVSRGIFVYSGTITFKSNPQNVSVTLDGKPTDSQQINKINNSVNLGGLIPKTYSIAISAPGFQTWTKQASVSSGLATEFWNVVLARNNYPKTRLGADGVRKFFISPKNDFLAYTTKNNQDLGIGIFDIGAKKTTANFTLPGWQFAGGERNENIEWGPDEAFVSIPVKQPIASANTGSLPSNAPSVQNITAASVATPVTASVPADSQTPKKTTAYDYIIANPKDGSYFDLKQFLSADNLNPANEDIRAVRWDPKAKGYLFFLIGKTLYRADIQTQGDIAKIADGVSAYDLSSSGVYYVQTPNDLVFKKNLDGSGVPDQIISTFPGSGNQDINRLTVYDDSRIAFLTPEGDLYIYNQGDHATYFKQLDSGIVDAQFSNDGKKLLFWSNYEISVYFTRDWTVQPTRSEDERQDITRYSEPITNVQWYSDYEHVIFNDGRYAKIIELDPRDHRNCLDLFNTTMESPFAIYDSSLNRIYFTDTAGQSTSLYSITFPEPTYLLGIVGLGGS